VLLVKADGRRKTGRPKLSWLHCIENYLKLSGFKRWRNKAQYRIAWAIILKEALVKLLGPYGNGDKMNAITVHTVKAF
jgi:hypothetical protein